MVRDAGFELAANPINHAGSSAMTHEQTLQTCEIMTLWGRISKPIRDTLLALIRAQANSVPKQKDD